MVTLAPQIPQQGDPEYLRYSKPIGSIEGNKSGYYLAKGIGEAVEEGTKAAVGTVGSYAENKTYEQLNAAAEAEGKRLDVAESNLLGGNANSISEPAKTDSSGSLIPTGQEEVPAQVNNGVKSIASLKEKYDHGKISETDYLADRARILKDLNAQYPGFRQYITAGASRATGEGSADQLIRSRIADYNSIVSKLGEQDKQIDTNLIGSLDQMPPDVRAKVIHDRWGRSKDDPQYLDNEKALQIGNQARYIDVSKTRELRDLEIKSKRNALSKEDAEFNVNNLFATASQDALHNFAVRSGASSVGELKEQLNTLSTNPDSAKAMETINNFRTSIDAYEADLRKQGAAAVKASGGKIGMGDINKQVDAIMQPYRQYLELAQDPKKVGSALYAATQFMEAQQRDIGLKASQSQLYKELSFLNLFKQQGELGNWVVDQFLKNRTDYGDRLGEDLNNFIKGSITTPPPEMKPPSSIHDVPKAASEAIDDANKKGASPRTLLAYANFASNISNPLLKDEEAKKLAYVYFNPKNLDMVGKWSRAAVDPKSGATYSNQFNVFRTLGSKEIADRIYGMGDPQLISYYKNFMEEGFKNFLWPGLMMDAEGAFHAGRYQIGFNDENQHFILKDKAQIPSVDPKTGFHINRPATNPFVEGTIARLNSAIDIMKSIAKHENISDSNAYLVSLIMDKNPQAFSREIPGMSGAANMAIQNQMIAREMQKQKEKEAMSKASKME